MTFGPSSDPVVPVVTLQVIPDLIGDLFQSKKETDPKVFGQSLFIFHIPYGLTMNLKVLSP